MGRRTKKPVTLTLDRLDPKGVSGLDDRGRRRTVGIGAFGAVVEAWPTRKDKASVLSVLTEAPDAIVPSCPVYGQCGGCQLQQVALERQRAEKQAMVERQVGLPSHPVRGAADAYGYRNKVELSFGRRAWTAEAGENVEGSYLGFHPPGWFSKVVPVDGCPLASDAMNAVIAEVAAMGLGPAWDNRAHEGVWRHLVVRQGVTDTGTGVVATLVTSSQADPAEIAEVAARLPADGVVWLVNDGVAEVATGELRGTWGSPTLRMTVEGDSGQVTLDLPHDAFFQVNTAGTATLFDTIAEALGCSRDANEGVLYDLYCGVGAIGLTLRHHFERIVGIELSEASISSARANAARLGAQGTWEVGPVEALLPDLWQSGGRIVVDPPRVGLHPRAAEFLAGVEADVLVYVACNPGSLGRDRVALEAGGWTLTDLWTVDLFPQTRHVEAVGRFVRCHTSP